MITFSEYIQMLTALIAIVNPISAIPLYLAFTENTRAERPRVARQTAVGVGIILLISLFIGNQILIFFGITIDGFRIAGGLLLLFMAFSMIYVRRGRAKHTKAEDDEAYEKDSVAIVPLAIPLLAGPGAISTVILFSNRANDWVGNAYLISACLIIAGLVWVGLRLGPQISDRIGTTGMNIFTRIMGLILASIAIEFVLGGLKNAFPGLVG